MWRCGIYALLKLAAPIFFTKLSEMVLTSYHSKNDEIPGESNREVILISKLHGYNVSNQDFPDSLIWLCQTVYLLLWQVSWQFEHALPDRWVLLWTGCVLVALRHSKWYLQNGQYTAVYSLGTNNRRVEWTIEKRIEDEWNSSGSRSFMSWHFEGSWK